jgi:hypothetical protein
MRSLAADQRPLERGDPGSGVGPDAGAAAAVQACSVAARGGGARAGMAARRVGALRWQAALAAAAAHSPCGASIVTAACTPRPRLGTAAAVAVAATGAATAAVASASSGSNLQQVG